MTDCEAPNTTEETPTDCLGRRRTPDQTRGLRPLFPKLDRDNYSQSVRIAMTRRAWIALEQAISATKALTRPRAIGDLLEGALGTSQTIDWQEWQIRKEKQLLERAS
jgi:hypothetical protein